MSVAESIPEITLQDMMERVAFPDSVMETPEKRITFRPKNPQNQTKQKEKQTNKNPKKQNS